MVAVVNEIVAVGIVGIGRYGRLVGDQPVAIGAIHEQPMQLRHQRLLLGQQGMQPRAVHMLEAVTFQAFGQGCGHYIHLAYGVFGMLGRGAGEVGHHVLGVAEGMAVVAPDAPALHHHESQHHHHHERQDQAEQPHGPALAGYREVPFIILLPGCAHSIPLRSRVRRL
ncbi:hypothetical protein D3C80_980090 [compost metagenome]